MKSFVVLGLGQFGMSLARTLSKLGHEVLAVDANEENVQAVAEEVTRAVIGDCADENTLRALDVRSFDVAVVAIGGDLESSILATVVLKELGVRHIVAKAQSDLHARALKSIGAERVVFPERDMGARVAHSLSSENILDYIELSPEFSIAELAVPETWAGKTLRDIGVREKHGVTVLACKNAGGVLVSPPADYVFGSGDGLIALGSNENLNALKNL